MCVCCCGRKCLCWCSSCVTASTSSVWLGGTLPKTPNLPVSVLLRHCRVRSCCCLVFDVVVVVVVTIAIGLLDCTLVMLHISPHLTFIHSFVTTNTLRTHTHIQTYTHTCMLLSALTALQPHCCYSCAGSSQMLLARCFVCCCSCCCCLLFATVVAFTLCLSQFI